MINPYNFVNITALIVSIRNPSKKGAVDLQIGSTLPQKQNKALLSSGSHQRGNPEIEFSLLSDVDIFGLVHTAREEHCPQSEKRDKKDDRHHQIQFVVSTLCV